LGSRGMTGLGGGGTAYTKGRQKKMAEFETTTTYVTRRRDSNKLDARLQSTHLIPHLRAIRFPLLLLESFGLSVDPSRAGDSDSFSLDICDFRSRVVERIVAEFARRVDESAIALSNASSSSARETGEEGEVESRGRVTGGARGNERD